MNEVSAREEIPLPIAECWEKLRDFERAIDYVPGLTELRITSEAREGVGASRVVVSKQAGPMDETITEWNEGKGFWLRLHRGEKGPMPPMREAAFEYALEAATSTTTTIALRMRYALGLGPIGSLLNALILRRVMERNIADVALALAENYVTDAKVTPERLSELRTAKSLR